MPKRVDQLLSGYADGDAISREARAFRAVFREMGYDSDIFAPQSNIAERLRGDAFPVDALRGDADSVLLYHFSIASDSTKAFHGFPGRRLLRYHNITPAEFFYGYDDALAGRLLAGRAELKDVVRPADVVLADSEYNASEIREAGCARVEVMELIADLEEVDPDEERLARFDDSFGNIMFVGRIVPNKCVEELILAFRWINKAIDPKSRLILVGSERSCPAYFSMLKMLASRLELDNVCFEGFLNEAELASCYCCADVFVTASRHEGYCLPLIEAMRYGIPVVARECGGMPEAMGGAGILFDGLDSRMLGELIAKAMWDNDFAAKVLKSQDLRLDRIRTRDIRAEWSRIL